MMTERELLELRACRAVRRQITAAPCPKAVSPKSYSIHLLVVMGLYLLGWVPGFIANLIILQEAEAAETQAGVPLPGVAGLRLLFVFTRALFILVALVLVVAVPLLWGLASTR